MISFAIVIVIWNFAQAVKIDMLNCGVDIDSDVHTGEVPHNVYPWVGILYYMFHGDNGEQRAVTTVSLIHEQFVIANAGDIGPMPKTDFRANSRVLLGHDWSKPGRRISSYVLHPEYGDTFNTIALVQLKEPVRQLWIKFLCPAPKRLVNPSLYVVKYKEGGFENLQKEVIPVGHIPGELCKEFYRKASLDMPRMRPPAVACVSSLEEESVCVWSAGAALVSRDVWGRWQLLGVGSRGPGCGAPSRYLDMMSYKPWIITSLDQFRRLTISKINDQKYILRAGYPVEGSKSLADGVCEAIPVDGKVSMCGSSNFQRFGACDPEEKVNLLYRENIVLRTDNTQYQHLTYNMTILQNADYTCLTLELVNATADAEMRVQHYCPRKKNRQPCYEFEKTVFDISVQVTFSDKCSFEMFAWGHMKKMTLVDYVQHRYDEGALYKDFDLDFTEYKGPYWMTNWGFEPLSDKMWTPKYDIWSTTEYAGQFTTTTDSATFQEGPPAYIPSGGFFGYRPTKTSWLDKHNLELIPDDEERTTTRFGQKKKFKLKSTTTFKPNATRIPGGFLFPPWG